MSIQLIADSGATKTEWCLIENGRKKKIVTQGISPYFLNTLQIQEMLEKELLPKLKGIQPDQVHYYGTGCSNPANVIIVKKAIRHFFTKAKVNIDIDLIGAARALCGNEKGIVSILGTGSNSCYYNGKRIGANSPGLGFILGDEGSGSSMGKRVLQYYLYKTFDPELMDRFRLKYNTDINEVLDAVYKKPLANRYMANFTGFLVENRGHFMVENIIEDCFNDFFFTHICKYKESWLLPIHFVGSVAFGFKDVLRDMCDSYELQLGTVLKKPMDGLIKYHSVI